MPFIIALGRLAYILVAGVVLVAACSKPTSEALVASARQHIEKQDAAGAVVELKSALQDKPDLPEARFLLGKALLDTGDSNAAAIELTKAIELHYPSDQAVPLLARALVIKGDHRQVVTRFENTSLSDPQAMASLDSSLGAAWAALGNKEKGDAAVAAALRAVPDYPPALAQKAQLLASAREYDAALTQIDRALERDPKLYEAQQLKGRILAYAKNDKAGAAAAFRKALEIDRNYLPAHMALFSIAIQNNDLAAAEQQAAALRAVAPDRPETTYVDAQLALGRNDLKKARALSDRLLQTTASHVGVLQLAGTIEAESGALIEAESHFSKALLIEPNLPGARRSLAQIYLRLGLPAKSLDVIKPVIGDGSTDAQAIWIAGDASLRLGNPAAAEKYFIRAGQVDPKDEVLKTTATVSRMGRSDIQSVFRELSALSDSSRTIAPDMAIFSARVRRGEYDEAMRSIEVMERKQPDSVTVLELRGRLNYLRGNLVEARKAYESALAKDPAFYTATASLATIDALQKKPQDAQKRLEAALSANNRNYLASIALAELRLREGAPMEEVRSRLAQAINSSPTEAAPRIKLIEILRRRNMRPEALAAARDAAATLPNNLEVLEALAGAQTSSSDTQQAITTYKQLATLDASSAHPYVRLGDLYKRRGEMSNAQAQYNRALEIDPSLEAAQNGLIDVALADKRTAALLESARTMQRRTADGINGLVFEARIHARLRQFEAALVSLRAALKIRPNDSAVAVLMSDVLSAADRKDDAARFAAEHLKAAPSDAVFEYHLVDVDLGRGDNAAAERRLRGMVERFPRDPLILNNLASTMLALGKPGALPFAERADFERPDQPPIIDTLASALAAEKKYERALAEQRRAVTLAPDDAQMRLNLAKIAIQAGDKARARKEIESMSGMTMSAALRGEAQKLLAGL